MTEYWQIILDADDIQDALRWRSQHLARQRRHRDSHLAAPWFGRDAVLERLVRFACGSDDTAWSRTMVVIGGRGSGKSALFSRLWSALEGDAAAAPLVLAHAFGPDSNAEVLRGLCRPERSGGLPLLSQHVRTPPQLALRRWHTELEPLVERQQFGPPDPTDEWDLKRRRMWAEETMFRIDHVPSDLTMPDGRIIRPLPAWFHEHRLAPAARERRIVLLVDDVEEFDLLAELPGDLPPNVRLIAFASTAPSPRLFGWIEARHMILPTLERADRAAVVRAVAAQVGFGLTSRVVDRLAGRADEPDAGGAAHPLWLRLAVAELWAAQAGGLAKSKLAALANELSSDAEGLVERALARLEARVGRDMLWYLRRLGGILRIDEIRPGEDDWPEDPALLDEYRRLAGCLSLSPGVVDAHFWPSGVMRAISQVNDRLMEEARIDQCIIEAATILGGGLFGSRHAAAWSLVLKRSVGNRDVRYWEALRAGADDPELGVPDMQPLLDVSIYGGLAQALADTGDPRFAEVWPRLMSVVRTASAAENAKLALAGLGFAANALRVYAEHAADARTMASMLHELDAILGSLPPTADDDQQAARAKVSRLLASVTTAV